MCLNSKFVQFLNLFKFGFYIFHNCLSLKFVQINFCSNSFFAKYELFKFEILFRIPILCKFEICTKFEICLEFEFCANLKFVQNSKSVQILILFKIRILIKFVIPNYSDFRKEKRKKRNKQGNISYWARPIWGTAWARLLQRVNGRCIGRLFSLWSPSSLPQAHRCLSSLQLPCGSKSPYQIAQRVFFGSNLFEPKS
jgi:hypothetical protein